MANAVANGMVNGAAQSFSAVAKAGGTLASTLSLNRSSPKSHYWVIGVLLALIASGMSNLGTNLQKLSHLKNGRKREADKRAWRESKTWILGIILLISASVVDMIALAFAPQSLVAPLGLSTLVSNVFLSHYLLGESVGLRDVTGVICLICGMSLVLTYGPKSDLELLDYNYQIIFALYERVPFLLYFGVVLILIAAALFAVHKLDAIRDEFGHDSNEYRRVSNMHRLLYSALAGTMASQNVLFGKVAAELISQLLVSSETESGRNSYDFLLNFWTYITLIMLVSSTCIGTYWLNQALVRFDASFVVPVFSTFWVSSATIGGLVFFKEAELLTNDQMVWFALGLIIAVLGLGVFASKPVHTYALDSNGRPVMYATPSVQGQKPPRFEADAMDGEGQTMNSPRQSAIFYSAGAVEPMMDAMIAEAGRIDESFGIVSDSSGEGSTTTTTTVNSVDTPTFQSRSVPSKRERRERKRKSSERSRLMGNGKNYRTVNSSTPQFSAPGGTQASPLNSHHFLNDDLVNQDLLN